MDQQAIIADIEAKARGAGVSIATVCRQAGVHQTTFSRWKRSPRNPEPINANLASLTKLYDALRDISRGQRQRRRARA